MKTYLIKDGYDDSSVCIITTESSEKAIEIAQEKCSDILTENDEIYTVELDHFTQTI